MRYIPLSLALIYLSIAAVANPVWATTVDPISKPKPISIACYIQAAGIKDDNPFKMNNILERELASGNFDRVLQLIPAFKFNTFSELNIRAAVIRQAITSNRNDIIDATLPQIVRLNSQLDREDKAYLQANNSWNIPLSLAQDLIKSGRTKSAISLLNHVETIALQESVINILGSQSTIFPAPDNEIIYIHPILIQIADHYSKADRVNDSIRLLRKFQRAVKPRKTGTLAFDSYLLAQSYLQAKQPQMALKLIATSRQQVTNFTDTDRQVSLLVAISKFYRSIGKSELSLQVLQQSIQIATKSPDTNLAALSLALLSSTANEFEQTQLAEELFKQSIQLAKKIAKNEQDPIWLGIADRFKQPAQRKQMTIILQQYQNSATDQTHTTVLLNILRQWLVVKEFDRANLVASQLIKIANQNHDSQILIDTIQPYLEGGFDRQILPIFPEFISAVQSLPQLSPTSSANRQLNGRRAGLFNTIALIYLRSGRVNLALSLANNTADLTVVMKTEIITWLVDTKEFDLALKIARSLPERVPQPEAERQFHPDPKIDIVIRSNALATIIQSAIRQDKLDLAQKLIPELVDPTIRSINSIELARAYLFNRHDPITANRILKTVQPTAMYQKYVENLQSIANCAMKNNSGADVRQSGRSLII